MSEKLLNNNDFKKLKNFVVFQTKTGKVNIEVLFKDETLWLSQKKISKLFQVDRSVITKHLNHIFKNNELEEKSVCAKIALTASDGKKYKTKLYSLQAILSVGYRVNSQIATEFRKWANKILQEYIVKGFAMDDERLKQIKHFGKDYFHELLERIHEIRLSERRIYQKITDIYALSADYDSKSEITKHFFATVQNKLHWAITGKTAAEIIYTKADAKKIHMGLKTWKQAPNGKILKTDVNIAKNYLDKKHIEKLNSLVNSYLDIAEQKARNRQVMNMCDWEEYLEQFLKISDYPILKNLGSISTLEAKLKAEKEYEKFRVVQDEEYISDFDKHISAFLQDKN